MTPPPDLPPGLLDHPPTGAPAYFLGLLAVAVLGLAAFLWPREPRAEEDGGPESTSAWITGEPAAMPWEPAPQARPLPLASSELVLTTDRPGAVVWLDGVEAGETPFRAPRLPAGTHLVRVVADEAVLLDTMVVVRTGSLYHLHVAGGAPPSPAPASRRGARRAAPPPQLAPIAPRAAADLPPAERLPLPGGRLRGDSTRVGW